MKPIMNYKEVQAALSIFYDYEAVQLTYAHPYEYPYVMSVMVDELRDFDVRVCDDMEDVFKLGCEVKPIQEKCLLCFYAK